MSHIENAGISMLYFYKKRQLKLSKQLLTLLDIMLEMINRVQDIQWKTAKIQDEKSNAFVLTLLQ